MNTRTKLATLALATPRPGYTLRLHMDIHSQTAHEYVYTLIDTYTLRLLTDIFLTTKYIPCTVITYIVPSQVCY